MGERRKVGSIFVDMVLGTATFDKDVEDFRRKFKKLGRDVGAVGKDLSIALTAPITLLGGMAIKASASFETAFAGVKKTVSATDSQFEQLRQGLLKMSTQLPVTVEDLTKFEQIGGQLNLKPEELEGFAKTMAQVSMSFDDISPEDAAMKMGQLATAVGMPMTQFSNLASAIAMTADTTASSEGPILEMAQRMSGIGKAANISVAEIVGMSAALSSVGINAEMGGSAMQKLGLRMMAAAETGAGVKEWAYVMGQSVQEFSKSFKEDAAGSIATFIERLQKLKGEGVSLTAVLKGLDIKQGLLIQTLLLAAGAGDQFRNTLNTSKKAFEDNSRLALETARRLETWDSKLKLLTNSWNVFNVQIGNDLKDILYPLVNALSDLGGYMSTLDPSTRKFGIAFAAVAAIVGPLLLTFSGLVALLGGPMLLGFTLLTFAAAGFAGLIAKWGPQISAGFNIVTQECAKLVDNVSNYFIDLGNKFREFSVSAVDNFKEMMRLIGEIITGGFNEVTASVQRGTERVSDFFHGMYMSVVGNSDVPDMIDEVGDEFGKLDTNMVGVANAATRKVMADFEAMGSKGGASAKKLGDGISKAVEKIGELSKTDTPIRKLSTSLQEILNSGKQGKELADALEKVRQKYSGTSDQIKIFNKALTDAGEKATQFHEDMDKLDQSIAEISGVQRFPKFSEQIREAFSQRHTQSAEEFNKKLVELKNTLVHTTEEAQAFEETLRKIEQTQQTSTLDKVTAGLNGVFKDPRTQDELDAFAKDLGDKVFEDVANGIAQAMSSGDVRGAIKDLGGTLGQTLGGEVFGPIGAIFGKLIGDKIGNDISKIGESTKSSIKGISTAIDTIFPGVGSAIGVGLNSVLGGSKDKDTQARDSIEKFLEDKLKTNIDFGSADLEPGWADKWWKDADANSVEAFTAIGEGLRDMLGITEDIGPQIGFILSENLGGNLDEARTLMQELGISSQDLEDAIIKQGIAAGESWQQIEVMLQGVSELSGEGLHGIGDLEGAFGRLIVTGGKGADAVVDLKNLAIEAMEAGAKTLQDLENSLRSSGKFTDAEITALMQSLGQRGITSLEQLKEASIRILGGVVADMLTKLGDNFGQSVDEVNALIAAIDSIPKDITTRHHFVTDEDKSGDSGSTTPSAKGNAFAFARGGSILRRKTNFAFSGGAMKGVAGEAGPEAIMPLTRVNGKLGVSTTGAGGSVSQDLYITINAPGASPGMEETLKHTVQQIVDHAAAKTLRILYESARR